MNTVLIKYLCCNCCEDTECEVDCEEFANTLATTVTIPRLAPRVIGRLTEFLCSECYDTRFPNGPTDNRNP